MREALRRAAISALWLLLPLLVLALVALNEIRTACAAVDEEIAWTN